ncbi:MAG: cell division protein FtsZ [Hallerella porci]|uniref:cell division protein FtsZ n=1 Tax=Hallerella TaxID=2815788 RepID=UPI0015674671|nr:MULTISPECIES: cell division protein FtsZ [Hallerella]MCI5601739.1 cell division protein FtsZ [Hallerella sp.]MDY3921511.1 cell division protein FtsZ [Hallerella porci]
MNEELNNMIPEDSEVRHIIDASGADHKAKIKIIGVGGAGGNAVNRMVKMNIKDVEFISINTDALALDNNLADEKIAIGQKTTKTLGAGAKPEIGRQALMEDKDLVEKKLEGADMIFISAGMGGGTGTGAAPVVAEIAHKLGILTVAVVTMPFKWEGPIRRRNAEKGLAALRKNVDSIIVINNQRILDVIEKTTSIADAYLKVDEVLGNAVRSICDIMFIHGTINVDFNDARTIMSNGGAALMGTGTASGEGRALKAAQDAITCPLLDNIKVCGASGALINVSHGENFSMVEYSEALDYLYQQIGEDNEPNIVAGDVTIPELGDRVSITVIATGFEKESYGEATATSAQTASAPVQAGPHIEKSIPRTNRMDFAKMATEEMEEVQKPAPVQAAPVQPQPVRVEQPAMETASETARMSVIRPVEETRAETSSVPVFTSHFVSSNFEATKPAVREEERTLAQTMPMPKMTMQTATIKSAKVESPEYASESKMSEGGRLPAYMQSLPGIMSENEF